MRQRIAAQETESQEFTVHDPGEFHRPAEEQLLAVVVRLPGLEFELHQTRPPDTVVDALMNPDHGQIKPQFSRDSRLRIIRFANQFGGGPASISGH